MTDWKQLTDKISYRPCYDNAGDAIDGQYFVSLLDDEDDPVDTRVVVELLTQEVGAAVERVSEWGSASGEPDVTAHYRRI